MALLDKELYLKIGRPQNKCAQCGAVISMAGKHPSALVDPDTIKSRKDDDAPLRHDYCASCWQDLTHTGYVGFWLARREAPKPRLIRTRKERNAALLSYFELLRERHHRGESRSEELYFLAHLLMKYSVLKWVSSTPQANAETPEVIVFRYATGGSDELLQIESVELDDVRVADIKRDIDCFLAQSAPQEVQAPPLAETA